MCSKNELTFEIDETTGQIVGVKMDGMQEARARKIEAFLAGALYAPTINEEVKREFHAPYPQVARINAQR